MVQIERSSKSALDFCQFKKPLCIPHLFLAQVMSRWRPLQRTDVRVDFGAPRSMSDLDTQDYAGVFSKGHLPAPFRWNLGSPAGNFSYSESRALLTRFLSQAVS